MNKGTKRNRRARKVRAMFLTSIAMFVMSVVVLVTSITSTKALSAEETRMMACSHDMKVESTMPTCDTPGLRVEHCDLCGYHYEGEIAPYGHEYIVEWNESAQVYAHACKHCGVVVHTHK